MTPQFKQDMDLPKGLRRSQYIWNDRFLTSGIGPSDSDPSHLLHMNRAPFTNID